MTVQIGDALRPAGLGFRFWGLGFRVQGLGPGVSHPIVEGKGGWGWP